MRVTTYCDNVCKYLCTEIKIYTGMSIWCNNLRCKPKDPIRFGIQLPLDISKVCVIINPTKSLCCACVHVAVVRLIINYNRIIIHLQYVYLILQISIMWMLSLFYVQLKVSHRVNLLYRVQKNVHRRKLRVKTKQKVPFLIL